MLEYRHHIFVQIIKIENENYMFIVYILLDIPRRHDIQEARLLPQETKSQNSF